MNAAPLWIHGWADLSPMHHPTCFWPLFVTAFMSSRVMCVTSWTVSVPSPEVAWKKMLFAKMIFCPAQLISLVPKGTTLAPQAHVSACGVRLVAGSGC